MMLDGGQISDRLGELLGVHEHSHEVVVALADAAGYEGGEIVNAIFEKTAEEWAIDFGVSDRGQISEVIGLMQAAYSVGHMIGGKTL